MASVGDDGVQLWDLAATREGDKLVATLPVGWSMAASEKTKTRRRSERVLADRFSCISRAPAS